MKNIKTKTYDGATAGLETLVVDKNISNIDWNRHLPVPLVADEIVFLHPDQTGIKDGSVRIIHGENKSVSVFSKNTLEAPPVVEVVVVESEESESITKLSKLTVEIEKIKEKKPTGISFMDKDYSKSGLVLAVVKQYLTDHPGITLEMLKVAFPDNLLRRFGIVQEIEKAKEIANGGARYFVKDDQKILLSDCVAVVCNQITSDNIKPFISAAQTLGYDIKIDVAVLK